MEDGLVGVCGYPVEEGLGGVHGCSGEKAKNGLEILIDMWMNRMGWERKCGKSEKYNKCVRLNP